MQGLRAYTRYLKHILSCLLLSTRESDFKTLAYVAQLYDEDSLHSI